MVGVLAVPTEAAQRVADDLVEAGVRIIFNYSEALLQVPPEVTVHTSRRPSTCSTRSTSTSPEPCSTCALAREVFEASEDFTVGLEEEFAILDPGHALAGAALRGAEVRRGRADEVLAESVAGELIVRDRDPLRARHERWATPWRASARPGRACSGSPASAGRSWAPPAPIPGARGRSSRSSTPSTTAGSRRASSTWPGATTPSACTCTWASAAPTARSRSATGCGRSCPSCWRSRPTRRSSTGATPACTPPARQIFTKSFPRCGMPEPFGSFAAYADYVDLLVRTGSIVEHTQLWWSVRPHHAFGTVEVRICDAQSTAEESDGPRRADRGLRGAGRARLRRRSARSRTRQAA